MQLRFTNEILYLSLFLSIMKQRRTTIKYFAWLIKIKSNQSGRELI